MELPEECWKLNDWIKFQMREFLIKFDKSEHFVKKFEEKKISDGGGTEDR